MPDPAPRPSASPAAHPRGDSWADVPADARAHSERLRSLIVERIDRAGGWIGFDRYMELALYEPALGYYAAKPGKIGADGDFVTAPEISPLFARALAAQVAQAFEHLPPVVLEFGAGSGALAAGLLADLERRGRPAARYDIVEVSAELRAVQRQRLPPGPVRWLDGPPDGFEGVIIANEVLDVMPVRLFVRRGGATRERGVSHDGGALRFADRAAAPELAQAVALIEAGTGALPEGYGSELGLTARAWTATLGRWLGRGLALLIDYGFPRHEYYHPQRAMGTVMCHFRHRAHAEPLWLPGLNDLTAHVDFSAIAQAGAAGGLDLLGYTSQARFLLNCGLLELMQADGTARAADALRLVSEAEMGELVKVMALGRGLACNLIGFAQGDRSHRLGEPHR